MTASIIDGKIISAEVRAEAKLEVARFVDLYKTTPCLAVVLVGENPASQVYVRTKSKMAKEIGMEVEDHIKTEDISETELIEIINQLNNDKKVNGILVQLPLPPHIDSRVIIDAIDPMKDADGFPCPQCWP
jgi:methylenetetrahydrofolate dehydrogenase (NADP+)/methenyltetrahydrofolate cyclohydrolase